MNSRHQILSEDCVIHAVTNLNPDENQQEKNENETNHDGIHWTLSDSCL